MARNVRNKKAAPQRRKRTGRRVSTSSSSSLNLDSDGGYSAVEDVSASEDDDDDGVFAAETENIIEAAHKRGRHPSRPVVSSEEEAGDADEEDDDGDSDDNDGDVEAVEEDDDDDDDDDEEEEDAIVSIDEGGSWNGIESDTQLKSLDGVDESRGPRRVRFADELQRPNTSSSSDSSSSDSTTSDTAKALFPDIFVDQNALDPGFRREIELESDSSISSSYWDYATPLQPRPGSATARALAETTPHHVALYSDVVEPPTPSRPLPSLPLSSAAAIADPNDLSDGETTDEEGEIVMPIPRHLMHKSLQVDDEEDEKDDGDEGDTEDDNTVRKTPRRLCRGTRPVAIMHPVTRKTVVFTRKGTTPSELQNMPHADGLMPFNPMDMNFLYATDDTHLPLEELQMASLDLLNSNIYTGLFTAQDANSAPALIGEDSDFSGSPGEDEFETKLRLEDFIQFDRAQSTGSTEAATDAAAAAAAAAAATAADQSLLDEFLSQSMDDPFLDFLANDDSTTPCPTTPAATTPCATSSPGADIEDEGDNANEDTGTEDPLLLHFDRNPMSVGAFRRNQIDLQLINSNKATPESLSFSQPYTMGTLRGIKNGSFEAVATPITPPRRPKTAAAKRDGKRSNAGAAPPTNGALFKTAGTSVGGDGGASSTKRKEFEDPLSREHKRQRSSISEFRGLHV